MASEITLKQPYLVRAMHEWMTDNGQTPHLVVAVEGDGIEIPRQYVRDGKIILNVSYAAAHNLDLGNDWIIFEARFAGNPQRVRIPISAVLGIYARETGHGMIFSEEENQVQPGPISVKAEVDKPNRAHLKVVK